MILTFILEPGARVEKVSMPPMGACKLIGFGFDLGTAIRLSHDARGRARLLADVQVESIDISERPLLRVPQPLAAVIDWENCATTPSGGRASPIESHAPPSIPLGATVRIACRNNGSESHTFTIELVTIYTGGPHNGH